MNSNAHAEERHIKNWYSQQHDTIVITAFLLCHKTQQKDTNFLNVLCVHKTQHKKVLNSLSLMMQDWMFSCFVPPLVRHSVEPCNGLFTPDDYLELVELCLILNRKIFLSRDHEKSRKQDTHVRCFMQVRYFCLKQGSYNYPRHHHNKNAAATAQDLFCLSL